MEMKETNKRKLMRLLRKMPQNVEIMVSNGLTKWPLTTLNVSLNEKGQWTLTIIGDWNDKNLTNSENFIDNADKY